MVELNVTICPEMFLNVDESYLKGMGETGIRNSGSLSFRTETSPLFKVTGDTISKFQHRWDNLSQGQKLALGAGILLPASIVSFSYGLVLPDLDILALGIGWHRHFLFHSSAGLWAARHFFEKYLERYPEKKNSPVVKTAGAVLAAGALGMGVHLLADGSFGLLDGQKSVVFGLPGIGRINTLWEGTYIDDNIYLLANSLWAFKTSKRTAVLTFADDFETAKNYTDENFPKSLLDSPGYNRFSNA